MSENKEMSMADLLDASDAAQDQQLKVGNRVKGEIISIGADTVFVDLAAGVDGVVDAEDLLNADGELTLSVGDEIELYIGSIKEHEIRLTKYLSGRGGAEQIEEAFRGGIPVEGKVKAECKGGFTVTVMGKRAFCPISQIDSRYVEDASEYVGKSYTFRITEFGEGGRNIVVSRRSLLEQEAEVAREEFMSGVNVCDIVEGRITKLMPFGAFVELMPGVEGMVHISELGWSRVEKPEDAVSVDEVVKVKVLAIEPGDKGPRISLSIKQVGGNPWEQGELGFSEGDRVKGRVIKCMDFGAFVEIAPGIEGLVHISEMSYTRRVNRPDEIVSPGDEVYVMVKGIERDTKRISLSMKEAEGDPWAEVAGKYSCGQQIEGTVEKTEKFGIFINLEPGITGLLPKSEIARSEKPAAFDNLKSGETVSVSIKEINAAGRKMTLMPSDVEDGGDWRQFNAGNSSSFGSLADKLQQAMNNKK